MDWHVGDSADASITSGRAEPMIIVGIYNTGKTRISEYTPTKVPKTWRWSRRSLRKFLLNELMPFIQETYRIERGSDATGIGGSSLAAW